ncbi:MAG: hypothetical protein AMXMBFR7_32950 [Planctomycetota bacterium]
MEAWDRVAWLAYHAIQPYAKDPKSLQPERFNPLRASERKAESSSLSDLAKYRAWGREHGLLPIRLSEAEKETAWLKWDARQAQREKEAGHGGRE